MRENPLERALRIAADAGERAYPKPTVGAVVVSGAEIVGEGATEVGRTGRHGERVALDSAGERARGAALFATMEPCAHHGSTPPCTDAILEAGVGRVVVGTRDPNPDAGGGVELLREAGVDVEIVEGEPAWRARDLNAGWLSVHQRGRPWVIYKAAVTLDARMTVPGERWVTGEDARRRVHELRAQVDAVAVGMGTVRADAPRLDARGVDAPRQPRRLAFGRGPLPDGSELELRSGGLEDELRALADEGVQTLLLEGGPTLGRAFLEADLVDKLLVFVAPVIAGAGPHWLDALPAPIRLADLQARRVGDDVLLGAYVHEP